MKKSLLLLGLLSFAGTASAQTIDTYPYWNGNNVAGSFGWDQSRIIGQSFTAPVDSRLISYTTSFGGSDWTMDFRLSVAKWDAATRMIGEVLYTSDVTNIPALRREPTPFTFDMDIVLIPGSEYVAYAMVYGEWIGDPASSVPSISGDIYTGGTYVDGSNASLPLNTGGDLDTAFRAEFTAMEVVPEPTSIAALGLGGLALLRRRKPS